MIKQCRICGKDFETITNGGSRQFCFDCVPKTDDLGERTNFKRQAMKKEGVRLLGGECQSCGESEYYLLDFHHLDGNEKDNNPSRLIADSKVEEFFEEIQKCILLCGNCHRKFHWLESNGQEIPTLHNPMIEDNVNRQYTRTHTELTCSKCGKIITKDSQSGLCSECSHFERRVVKDRPDANLLVKEIQDTSISAVARKYGVSDTSIRKWLKVYGLPTTIKEIKKLNMGV